MSKLPYIKKKSKRISKHSIYTHPTLSNIIKFNLALLINFIGLIWRQMKQPINTHAPPIIPVFPRKGNGSAAVETLLIMDKSKDFFFFNQTTRDDEITLTYLMG